MVHDNPETPKNLEHVQHGKDHADNHPVSNKDMADFQHSHSRGDQNVTGLPEVAFSTDSKQVALSMPKAFQSALDTARNTGFSDKVGTETADIYSALKQASSADQIKPLVDRQEAQRETILTAIKSVEQGQSYSYNPSTQSLEQGAPPSKVNV